MRISLFCLLFMLLTSAHAQMYKWVDANGKVHFSDQPPPRGVAQVEMKDSAATSSSQSNDFPYLLAHAAKTNPVTLYSTRNCLPCDEGRVLLKKRGIPFAEKTVNTNADIKKLKELGSENSLPLLVVGASKQVGFDVNRWDALLTGAGYPQTSQLPDNYRYASPEPIAPPAVAEKSDAPKTPEKKLEELDTKLAPAKGNAPEGFRF